MKGQDLQKEFCPVYLGTAWKKNEFVQSVHRAKFGGSQVGSFVKMYVLLCYSLGYVIWHVTLPECSFN